MAQWANINENSDRFRLLCDDSECSLSLANLLSGKLHITSVHGNKRHSYTCSTQDMLFIVSQFMKNLSRKDREKLLNFYKTF